MIPVLWTFINYVLNEYYGWNWTIVWANQNAPRAAKPYVVINITNITDTAFDNTDSLDENGFQDQSGFRIAVVELQFYGGISSITRASLAQLQLSSTPGVDKMVELDVAIGNRLFLGYVPALLNNSQFEHRSIYTFQFYYTDMIKDNVGLIETVDVTGSYSGSLTDQSCHEIISISETEWDDDTTDWDDAKTAWDRH